jgi:hypothetical protein
LVVGQFELDNLLLMSIISNKVKHKLVLIEWLDSRTPTSSWQFLDEVVLPEPCKCISVGFLLRENKTHKILAAHLNDLCGDAQVMGVMTIPKCAIIKITQIAYV